jgi:hypothetical protein
MELDIHKFGMSQVKKFASNKNKFLWFIWLKLLSRFSGIWY